MLVRRPVFGLLVSVLAACSPPAPSAPPPPGVTVAATLEREINEWDEFSGRLDAVDAVEVRPRVSGYIQRIAFAEGPVRGELRPLEADIGVVAEEMLQGVVDDGPVALLVR